MVNVKIVILEETLKVTSQLSFRSIILFYHRSIVVILDPSKSWLRKRLGLTRKIVAGSYAV